MTVDQSTLNEILTLSLAIPGAMGVAVGDSDSGMCLAAEGDPGFDLELAIAVNTEVVRAKKGAMQSLKIDDTIEDILITLGKQYHLIRLVEGGSSLFIYLALDRAKSNLAMARHNLREIEKKMAG